MKKSSYVNVIDNVIVEGPADNGTRDRRRGLGSAELARTEGSRLWLIVPAIGLSTVAWFAFAFLYTEYLWFSASGYHVVFTSTLTAGLISALVLGSAAGIFTYLNVWLAVKRSGRLEEANPKTDRTARNVEAREKASRIPSVASQLRHAPLPLGILVGFSGAIVGWGLSAILLGYFYQVPFGLADPIFGRDISFYMFTLPVIDGISLVILGLLIISLIGAAAIYLAHSTIEGGGESKPGRLKFPSAARPHLAILSSAVFLLVAWKTYYAMPQLLLTGDGAFFGASYADLYAALPLLWAQLFAALLAAVVAIVCAFRSSLKPLWAAAALVIVTAAAGWLYPSLVQRFSVAPNELAKEMPFIRHNIEATRTAFNLNNVEEHELSGAQELTATDIRDNQRTVNNIRLRDTQPLLDTFAQIQEIRTYYEFASVDNDRYLINGEMQQVMISPREMNAESLPNRNWINEHLTFTHGYGAAVGPVDKVTPEGLPELFVKNLPPVATVPELKIERPEIYFGEVANDRVYVNTKTEEFSHPAGEQNVFRNYSGDGGVSVGSTFRQLLFATRFLDLKLLLSDDLTADSRVLQTRNIRERLQKVAPYLRFDSDPYLVINEGKLIWIADGYTASKRYPYSQPVDGVNYIRNSVKATVDAYDGTVNLYVADERDPIIQTQSRIFPGTLQSLKEMPDNLRAHLRYPEDIFRTQARVFATYQMDEPQEFYNKEDQWTIAQMPASAQIEATKPIEQRPGVRAPEPVNNDGGKPMEPYYTIMKLPGEQQEEFILMLPFTPQRKDNLAAWMVARSDGENYGRLAVYRFPKQQLVFGPKQIVARINQDPEISRQLALWNQRGSRVMLGTLMVIPIKESLIYVQPLYLRAESGKIPELRRVIVAHGNRITMEDTLDKSLGSLFGDELGRKLESEKADDAVPVATVDSVALVEQAQRQYEAAVQAQRSGDWARYGEEIKLLGETLEKLTAGKPK